MIRISTGMRNSLCVLSPLVPLMDGGTIYLYGGTIPASPDYPPGTPMLGQITTDGADFIGGDTIIPAGLRIQWVHPGAAIMVGNWIIRGKGNGTVTWFRWCWSSPDENIKSLYKPRLDGTIGDVLRMSNPVMTTSRVASVESFLIILPQS